MTRIILFIIAITIALAFMLGLRLTPPVIQPAALERVSLLQLVADEPAELPVSLEAEYLSAASGAGGMIHCQSVHSIGGEVAGRLYNALKSTFESYSGQNTPMGRLAASTLMILQHSAAYGVWLRPGQQEKDERGVVVDQALDKVDLNDVDTCTAVAAELEVRFLAPGKLLLWSDYSKQT